MFARLLFEVVLRLISESQPAAANCYFVVIVTVR